MHRTVLTDVNSSIINNKPNKNRELEKLQADARMLVFAGSEATAVAHSCHLLATLSPRTHGAAENRSSKGIQRSGGY